MKTPMIIALSAVLAAGFMGCSTPQERAAREARYAREDAQDDADRARRDRQDYDAYLAEYARDLGKTPSQLTSSERAAARSHYDGPGSGHHYGRGYRYWY